LWLVAAGVAAIGVGGGVGHSVPVVAAGFGCVGLGIGGVDVLLNVEGAAVEAAAGRTLMPLMHAAWSAGAVLGAAIGAGAAAARVPIVEQFGSEAVVLAVVAAVAVRSLPATAPAPRGRARGPLAVRVRAWLGG